MGAVAKGEDHVWKDMLRVNCKAKVIEDCNENLKKDAVVTVIKIAGNVITVRDANGITHEHVAKSNLKREDGFTFKAPEEDDTTPEEAKEDGTSEETEDGITATVLEPDAEQVKQLKSSQFGFPCEFKTPVFMEPFKFYTKHEEGIKLVHGQEVKLHHKMQVIRTITDANMLNKEGVELKRTRALDMLTQRIKDIGKKVKDIEKADKVGL